MNTSESKYPNDPEQTVWLMQTQSGNSLAFNNIVEKYQQSVYNLCYHMLQNVDDAEDAAQEVFARAYVKLGTYDSTSKFSTWLFSIASHYCIDQLRKRRFQMVPWDDLASWYRFSNQTSFQPEKTLIETEAKQELRSLLNQLPPDYRAVVVLKYWYSMPYQEIAAALKTTVGAVKSKLFRARKMMATSAILESQTNLRGAQNVFC